MSEINFSEVLKQKRKDLNLTSEEMASRLGIKLRMYQLYERGDYDKTNSVRRDRYLQKLTLLTAREPDSTYERKGNIIAVPLHAYGGFLQGYKNIVYMDSLERFTLPDVFGEHYAFEVQGVSMIDFANPGDWAISRWEENPDYMAKGKPYVLQTIDGILIKDFDRFEGKDEKRRAWFTSRNKEYEPISIPVKELKKIYFVNRILKKV